MNSHTKHSLSSVFCSLLSHIRGTVSREEVRDVLVAEIRSILLDPVTAVRDVPERERERSGDSEYRVYSTVSCLTSQPGWCTDCCDDQPCLSPETNRNLPENNKTNKTKKQQHT